MDLAKPGKGTIQFVDNVTVKGFDTSFTKDFKLRDNIKPLPNDGELGITEQIITEIISDTELKVS